MAKLLLPACLAATKMDASQMSREYFISLFFFELIIILVKVIN
jgi:hypothetical protein